MLQHVDCCNNKNNMKTKHYIKGCFCSANNKLNLKMRILIRKGFIYLIINLLFVFCKQAQSKAFQEIISDPINLSAHDNKIVRHSDLPVVTDEVSITLRLNILSHHINFAGVFHKGTASYNFFNFCSLYKLSKLKIAYTFRRTIRLYSWGLADPNASAPHVRFSTKDNYNEGIGSVGEGLSLNKWYHLAYTLSEPERQLEFYMDGQLAGLLNIQSEIVFNNGPLFIGYDFGHNGITGQIRYDLHSHSKNYKYILKMITFY
jgi:hypothetical protein